MTTVLSILRELESDNSRLAKEAILKRERGNKILIKVLQATLDPYLNYWIKKIPEYTEDETEIDSILLSLDQLQDLATRKVTGHAAIEHLRNILSRSEEPEVIERIIERDLKCGVSEATVNKIWPGLIPTFDVMLAYKDVSGIKYPAYAQVKSDGMRCHLYFDGSSCIGYTRSGKIIDLKGALDESGRALMREGEVWDGEIIFVDNGKVLDRKTGNGLGNKGVKGTISEAEAAKARFVAWDVVDFSSTISYKERLYTLNCRFKDAFQKQADLKILAAETIIVNSEEEAMTYYNKCIAAGEEGSILKNIDAVWQPKRTKDLGKLKAELDCTLRVVKWVEGTGKYSGMLGALECASEDGLVYVSVGSGFTDEERKTLTEKNSVGKLIDVRYNARIKSKGTKTESLFLPRVIEFRTDKTKADTSSAIV